MLALCTNIISSPRGVFVIILKKFWLEWFFEFVPFLKNMPPPLVEPHRFVNTASLYGDNFDFRTIGRVLHPKVSPYIFLSLMLMFLNLIMFLLRRRMNSVTQLSSFIFPWHSIITIDQLKNFNCFKIFIFNNVLEIQTYVYLKKKKINFFRI